MKRGVTLLVCLVLLGGLIGAYFYLGNHPKEEAAPSESPDKTVKLIDKQKWEIESIHFSSKGNDLTILSVVLPTQTPMPTPSPVPDEPTPSETPTPSPTPTPGISFTVAGFEDEVLDYSSIDNMARLAYSLSAAEKVSDNGNPKDFRLNPPDGEINVKYTDGSEKTIYVGMQTPTKDYYYFMVKGDPAIYMVTTTVGERAFFGAGNILSKALPAISSDALEYVYIQVKGKDTVEFAHTGTEEELENSLNMYGAVPLNMVQPYKGWDLYNTNFQSYVLDGMSGISIGDLIEAKPEDYSKYGLDDPTLIVWLIDANGELHLEIGDDADKAVLKNADENTAYAYVRFAGRPAVYVMDKSYLSTLYNINIFNFTQRFVALQNIDSVNEITIKSPSKDYEITLNREFIPVTATPTPTYTPTPMPDPDASEAPSEAPPEEANTSPAPTPTPEMVIHPKINGKEIEDKAFRTFYQAVIGLSYDISIDTFTPTGLPEITITYRLNTGEPNVVTKYFRYNNDFYAVQKNDNAIQFVVSKQYIDQMLRDAEKLLAGNLNE